MWLRPWSPFRFPCQFGPLNTSQLPTLLPWQQERWPKGKQSWLEMSQFFWRNNNWAGPKKTGPMRSPPPGKSPLESFMEMSSTNMMEGLFLLISAYTQLRISYTCISTHFLTKCMTKMLLFWIWAKHIHTHCCRFFWGGKKIYKISLKMLKLLRYCVCSAYHSKSA